jgi:hypothetical protein
MISKSTRNGKDKCSIPGLGSHNKEEIERRTREIVNAGDHWSFKISKQIAPFLFTFG